MNAGLKTATGRRVSAHNALGAVQWAAISFFCGRRWRAHRFLAQVLPSEDSREQCWDREPCE